jgi:hypothetical protein
MKGRQERVIAQITIRKLKLNAVDDDGNEYAVVVEFGEKIGRVAKFFKTYEEALLYANESSQFLWSEDYKDEMA